jgi:murein DD-endopeptidase MepM/ murein hydrolase activator NlpD
MQDEPGTHELAVDIKTGDQTRHVSMNVLVVKEVSSRAFEAAEEGGSGRALARWKAEQEQVKAALAEDSRLKLWQGGFLEPVGGKRTGIFGSVRIMNGQARNPHNGEDIGAPMGTDVLATNDGVVRLTVDHIFSGKGVYVDHGLGFYSMYFHLSEVSVKEGDLVKAGQVVGKVSATGQATGPHLHWGVKLKGLASIPMLCLICRSREPFSRLSLRR